MVRRRSIGLVLCALGSAAILSHARQDPARPEDALFTQRVRPILEQSCLKCHHSATRKAGLDLSTREALLKGGDGGPAIVPGDRRRSLLYQVVAHVKEPFMPHRMPRLSEDRVESLGRWIDQGAPYATPLHAPANASAPERHWSLRPLRRPVLPSVRNESWVRTPVDRFILAALEAKGLDPNPAAPRAVLIRRAAFDLLGLPPAPGEVESFLNDPAPDAWARLVDRLLGSPHHGERWAGHWLDVARYAESGGFENDWDRPHAYPYRDFVIRALNDDLPYDTFVRWQLAGDLLEPGRPEAVAATGFLAAGPRVWVLVQDSDANREQYRYDYLDDVVSTIGSGLLGLSVGCARCHDHKYDPIRSRDYYRMVAAFQSMEISDRAMSTPMRELEDWLRPRKEAIRLERIAALKLPEGDKHLLRQERDRIFSIQGKLHDTYGPRITPSSSDVAERASPEERAVLERLQAAAAGRENEKERVLAVRRCDGAPPKSYLLARGDPRHKTEEAAPGALEALSGSAFDASGDPRASLAAWMTDIDRGAGALLARVIVNRLWHHHFGEGLVRTPNDFGAQGDLPVHRELLDWLASELVSQGWRLKPIHRMILESAVYRQSSDSDARRSAIDPDNRLWWKRRPLRLDAETIRDTVLAVSGRLDLRRHGPSVRSPIPAQAIATRSQDKYPVDLRDGPDSWRRSIYLFRKRSVPVPLLETFDAPSPSASCGRRTCSTVSPQALALLNDPFLRTCSEDLARRVRKDAGEEPAGQVERAFRLALGRSPTRVERETALSFLGSARPEKLADFGQALLCLNEFIYVD